MITRGSFLRRILGVVAGLAGMPILRGRKAEAIRGVFRVATVDEVVAGTEMSQVVTPKDLILTIKGHRIEGWMDEDEDFAGFTLERSSYPYKNGVSG